MIALRFSSFKWKNTITTNNIKNAHTTMPYERLSIQPQMIFKNCQAILNLFGYSVS